MFQILTGRIKKKETMIFQNFSSLANESIRSQKTDAEFIRNMSP